MLFFQKKKPHRFYLGTVNLPILTQQFYDEHDRLQTSGRGD